MKMLAEPQGPRWLRGVPALTYPGTATAPVAAVAAGREPLAALSSQSSGARLNVITTRHRGRRGRRRSQVTSTTPLPTTSRTRVP